MKHIVQAFLFLTLSPLLSFSQTITVSGTVSGTWDADSVLVIGDILIPDSQNLIVSPGTYIEFQGPFKLDVLGCIVASGLENDSIVFSMNDTSGFSDIYRSKGGWKAIRFNMTAEYNDTSRFTFCRFQFGKAAGEDSISRFGGAINIKEYSKVVISHCRFYHNYAFNAGAAVYLKLSDIHISNNVFESNLCGSDTTGYGGGIHCELSRPTIVSNLFSDNWAVWAGGGLSAWYCDPDVENNIFIGNSGRFGGGFGLFYSHPMHMIVNNLFTENTAEYFGGGLCCIDSDPVYSNNTIADNTASYGGGFYCNDSAQPEIYNTIIWNNYAWSSYGNQVYIWDVYSAPDFFYCDVQGGPDDFGGSGSGGGYIGIYESNIDADPGFIGNGDYPWALNSNSPCIDTGINYPAGLTLPAFDLAMNPRILNQRVDMGAYESVEGIGIREESLGQRVLTCTPNPFTESIIIGISIPCKAHIKVYIYDTNGKLVRFLYENTCEQGLLNLIWDGRDDYHAKVNSGMYLIRLQINDKNESTILIKQ